MTTWQTTTTRRSALQGIAGLGLAIAGGTAHAEGPDSSSSNPRSGQTRIPPMKITEVKTILTGSDVFLKIRTDVGLVGYGEATNHFLPESGISARRSPTAT